MIYVFLIVTGISYWADIIAHFIQFAWTCLDLVCKS